MEEVEKEELSQKERLLPWAVMVKGQLEISRRLPKKLIAVKQKDGRDKSKTRRLLLKDLIYVIFSKRQIEPCVLKTRLKFTKRGREQEILGQLQTQFTESRCKDHAVFCCVPFVRKH